MIDPANPDYSNTPVSPQRPAYDYQLEDIETQPRVSLLTPIFNTGHIFRETINSVCRQSFQQWEWIIVNDGSTNQETLEMLAEVAAGDKRVRLINLKTNEGLGVARNVGFAEAVTPYVVLLDSDDLLEPTALEKWYWFLESHPEYSFVKGFTVGFDVVKYLQPTHFGMNEAFLDKNQLNPTSMIRKAVHQAMGGFEVKDWDGLEDWEFWLKCANAGYWGGNVPEYLDWYRMRETNYDRWPNLTNEMRPVFREKLKERYPKLWAEGFPKLKPAVYEEGDALPENIPCENKLKKTKNRLLMLINRPDMGGASKFNLDVIREMTRKGWEVTVVCTPTGDDNPLWPAFAALTPDIFILPYFLQLPDYPRFLRYLIASRQFDAVFLSCSIIGYTLLPIIRDFYPNLPILDYCHIEYEAWRTDGFPALSIQYRSFLDLQLVSSEHLKNWLVERQKEAERVRVCYTNINPQEWKPDNTIRIKLREEYGAAENVPLILFSGRLVEQKQPKVLAQALLQLHTEGVEFKALVVGYGPNYSWLETFIEENGLTRKIALLGPVANSRVKELLSAADIYFLPSKIEGISLAIYEAMSMGVSPVVADVGGQRELVSEECGILIKPSTEAEEVQQYAAAIAHLVQAPDLLKGMKKAARERVLAHFQIKNMADRLEALIFEAKALNQNQPREISAGEILIKFASQVILRDYKWLQIEQGNKWLNEQRENWERIAYERKVEIEKLVTKQHETWLKTVEDHEKLTQQLQLKGTELKKLSDWSQSLETRLVTIESNRIFQLLKRLGLFRNTM